MQRISIRWHILFWLGLVILGTAALSPYYMNLFKATLHRIIFIPVWLVATYTNLYVLMPRLWDKGKTWMHVSLLTILILGLTIIQRIVCIQYFYPQYFWMRAPNADELNPFWIGPFIQFAAFIALPVILTIGIRIAWRWYQDSYKSKQILAEQQAAELNYLKAQINPHFLFNTLNNLYGLSLESSKKVPGMILKLSDLLSYSLYESKVDLVSIEKEMILINQFVALEKERYNERVEVHIDIDKNVNMQIFIAPLLLLPLVENAFKHGVKESLKTAPINIHLSQCDDAIGFIIENNNPNSSNGLSNHTGGLGLKNLRRRLELRYPHRHNLDITNVNDTFRVYLQIELND